MDTAAQNTFKIKNIAVELPIAKAVFKSLVHHKFNHDMDLRRRRQMLMATGVHVSTKDYIEVFKKLQKAGFGKLVAGVRPDPSRFYWSKSLTQRDIIKALSVLTEEEPTGRITIPSKRQFSFPWGEGIYSLPLDGVSKEEIDNLVRTLNLFAAKL